MDKKISQLSSAAALTGTEVVPVVQGGSTVKTTTQDIADLAGGVPYLTYVAKFNFIQYDGVDQQIPTISVMENTIGNIVWSWFPPEPSSLLFGTLTGAFPTDKTFVLVTVEGGSVFIAQNVQQTGDPNSVAIRFFDDTYNYVVPGNSSRLWLEIRVYP